MNCLKIQKFLLILTTIDLMAGGCCSTQQTFDQSTQVKTIKRVYVQQPQQQAQQMVVVAAVQRQAEDKKEHKAHEDKNNSAIQENKDVDLKKLLNKYNNRLQRIKSGKIYNSDDFERDKNLAHSVSSEDGDNFMLKMDVIEKIAECEKEHQIRVGLMKCHKGTKQKKQKKRK